MRGFTLIELIVTISLMAIVLAIAVPVFKPLVGSSAVKGSAHEIMAAMNLARSEAVSQSGTVTMIFTVDATASGYEIRDPEGELIRAGRLGRGVSYSWDPETMFKVNEEDQFHQLKFLFPLGAVNKDDSFQENKDHGIVTVTNGTKSLSIVVNLMGRCSVNP